MDTPNTPRAFTCRCGRPVFFRNSECLACHTPLGYSPSRRALLPLQAADEDAAWWREADVDGDDAPRFRRCSQLATVSGCNWLIDEDDSHAGEPPQCRSCRLTRTLPDLSVPENGEWWRRIEQAKRRLVSSLIGFGLPVENKFEDPARGLVFDLLRSLPGGPPVMTGHDDGVITVDVDEADDATREQRRSLLREPYRTLLGHLRHESGHYYWQRLVDGSEWLEPCRGVFGDEREDYPAALQRYYTEGPPADWGARHVSAYASSHPWEDWAETWAHYLHLVDTLETARSFGLDNGRVELNYEAYGPDVLDATPDDAQASDFLLLLNGWMELTGVLNELSRSMGVADFYPFVLSQAAVRKLYFIHRVVSAAPTAATANAAVEPAEPAAVPG